MTPLSPPLGTHASVATSAMNAARPAHGRGRFETIVGGFYPLLSPLCPFRTNRPSGVIAERWRSRRSRHHKRLCGTGGAAAAALGLTGFCIRMIGTAAPPVLSSNHSSGRNPYAV